MKNILIVLLLCLKVSAYSQTQQFKVVVREKLSADADADQNDPNKKFENDLRNESLHIYVQGGIVSVIRPEDKTFEKKHNITYHDFGCVIPPNLHVYIQYNKLVFKHLTAKFGADWQKEVNKSAIGFSEPKTVN